MPIDRCYCMEVTFESLKALAAEVGPSIDELSRLTQCCTACGLCRPYIRVMLKTGRTQLPVLSSREVEEICGPDTEDAR